MEETENISPNSTPSTSSLETSMPPFMKKRKIRENVSERRHMEKMARYDKFLDLFQMSVEHQIGKTINIKEKDKE